MPSFQTNAGSGGYISSSSSSSKNSPPSEKEVRPRKKRSRKGCLSCKRLKIKCDENKPVCEYCYHTGRDCLYPEVVVTGTETEDYNHESARLLSFHAATLLNSNWQNLRISKFEYRLLHFFQTFCVPLFSFNVNFEIDKVWRYEVPKLWQSSDLVKQAVFSFSALNMWPLCSGDSDIYVNVMDDEQLMIMLGNKGKSEIVQKLFLGDSSYSTRDGADLAREGSLFEKTTSYFMNSLSNTSQTLSESGALLSMKEQGAFDTKDELVFKSAELVISGILIFSFLGLHPHKLIPLIAFDEDSEDGSQQTDLISICAGIHNTLIAASPTLLGTAFRGLFNNVERYSKLPTTHKSYPVIIKLKSCLTEWIMINQFDELIDSESSEIIEVFNDSISLLDICYFRAVESNYPIPLFRWILAIDGKLRTIVKTKNQFALKLLYYYAVLCVVCRFSLFKTTSVWIDYMKWYRDYNINVYGSWLYSDDLNLYNLVFDQQFIFELNEFSDLAKLDPDDLSALMKK
ncbi:hypothetical protein CLIB1423_11S00430 [[Candida] railenensis]|uniref:Zn(2)-C6 fungal-type domain-containing protein n=1 Tax=[Candida] railenensis TaxID=45579 RepID=A0A9P0VY95_9ASCO|nr:hypothetical protein CLIB1423_11S00430 [[Candida] railenensis]